VPDSQRSQTEQEDRVIEIEIKLAHQEDLLESLNNTVYQQQLQIDKLEALCAALVQQMREVGNANRGSGMGATVLDERPPHY
jgi:SlyX protein